MGNKINRSTSAPQLALDALLSRPSALHSSMFSLHATAHHGVPSNAQTLAFCGLQGILAVGTASGAVKLYGAEGIEVLLEGPTSVSHLAVGVTHLKFTARQRLVVIYTDNSIRVVDLASGAILCCVSRSWTTSVVTSIETISYSNFPFFFVATDNGEMHVIQEETGQVSTYIIRPQDLTARNADGVTAMASHPRDSNLLLIAYDSCPDVLLWDFSRRKVVRKFSLLRKVNMYPETSDVSSADVGLIVNSPQSLSWHGSGKRFVAGYKQGGFSVFQVDKPHGIYRYATGTVSSKVVTPVKQINWVCAPPTSKHAVLPGAIVLAGGRSDNTESKLLTVIYPPRNGRSTNDVLVDLYTAETLVWSIATIESANHAEIVSFIVAHDQVDYSSKLAPLSLILLSGNSLDGCLPTVSVQGLPCFVKLCDGDEEEWEWRFDRLPEPAVVPPLLHLSPLKTFALVNLSDSDSTLQDDLLSTWNQAKYNPMFRFMDSSDFEWPINGGSILEPMLKKFATPCTLNSEAGIAPNGMILLTGHANGYVLFWEARTAGDCVSKGAIRLIHVVDVSLQMSPASVNTEITCLTFCAGSRTLVVGFASGAIVVLEFVHLKKNISLTEQVQENKCSDVRNGAFDLEQKSNSDQGNLPNERAGQNEAVGFRTLFFFHVHTEPISKLVISSLYGYVCIADAAGMASLVNTKTQSFQVLVCDFSPACDESMLVGSLLISELVQTTEIPGSGSLPLSSLLTMNKSGGKGSRDKSGGKGSRGFFTGDENLQNTTQYREVVIVLFVGRGSGKLEMYHVQSATKMGETLVDPEKTTSLSSILMVDSDGKRIEIPSRKWVERDTTFNIADGVGNSTVSIDMLKPKLTEDRLRNNSASAINYQPNWQALMASASFESTQQLVMEAKDERSKAAAVEAIPADVSNQLTWTQSSPIEITVPPGSLGLHLFMEVEQHAVVKGFADDSSTAILLANKGIRKGYTLTAINGVNVIPFDRDLVCRVLEKLRDYEKVLVFAVGFKYPGMPVNDEIGSLNGPLVESPNAVEYERPRFLVCTCGKVIHVVQTTVPRAAEMATGPKDIPVVPLASVELQGVVLVTSLIRIPVGEGFENCLAVVDQSKRVYVLSLLSLKLIWEADLDNFGFRLGYSNLVDISYGGELVLANAFGEIERFSLLAEATAMERAMLESMSIKMRLYLPERATIFDQAGLPPATDSGKKRGIAADAGKIFKKLVFSVTQEVTDLNKIFHFSSEEDDRRRLIRDRCISVKDATSATSQTEMELNTTTDTLMQAQQRLAERGEKLNDLGLKAQQMKKMSEDFYQTMKAFNEKNASKKWYEL
ncbi:unnamed protein product [Peronospora belbahrii]|uniref:V-SNARE coiled-coil homology domain-containing protein n=1 Tax=Peronospora belbahrii TaxID=622444 RepID=A0AAU9KFU9_9STRA|nr:unnamed protein product [Peronospora belbahrii]CAH0518218.1 unnamed protein product [Peronospora belbahrii]